MVVRKTIFTVICASLLCHTVIAQDLFDLENNSSTEIPPTTPIIPTTEPDTKCNYPEEFPLFGDDTCISREAYAAIFLISIILAGISFLSLAILLFCLCCRYWRSADSYYDGDSEISSKPGSENNQRNGAATNSNEKKTEIGNSRSHPNDYDSANNYTAPKTTSAPYAVDDPVETEAPRLKSNNPRSKKNEHESIPLETRKPSNPGRIQPLSSHKKVTDLDDSDHHHRGRGPTKFDSIVDATQF